MDIQPIGEDKLVIYLNSEEIKQLPAHPGDMTNADAKDILRLALGSTYNKNWDSVCFELFPGKDSLLMFALQHSGCPAYFIFPGIEPLISAAKACQRGLISYLTHIGDEYILILYPISGQNPPKVLFEYGEELLRPTQYALHLSEHTNVIAGPTALDEIRDAFA